MTAPIISLKDVSFSYPDGTVALERMSLDVLPGESIAIVGPNGAGKSTLLQIIAGLVPASRGVVTVCGKNIDRKSVDLDPTTSTGSGKDWASSSRTRTSRSSTPPSGTMWRSVPCTWIDTAGDRGKEQRSVDDDGDHAPEGPSPVPVERGREEEGVDSVRPVDTTGHRSVRRADLGPRPEEQEDGHRATETIVRGGEDDHRRHARCQRGPGLRAEDHGIEKRAPGLWRRSRGPFERGVARQGGHSTCPRSRISSGCSLRWAITRRSFRSR